MSILDLEGCPQFRSVERVVLLYTVELMYEVGMCIQYIRTYICTYVHVHTYVCTYVCMYVHTYICAYVCKSYLVWFCISIVA